MVSKLRSVLGGILERLLKSDDTVRTMHRTVESVNQHNT